MGKELGPSVPFFPEFRKIDQFKVRDVALGAASCHVVTVGGEMYACGDNEWGQYGNGSKIGGHEFSLVSCGVKFMNLAAGAFHVMGLTEEGKCYGWGRMN